MATTTVVTTSPPRPKTATRATVDSILFAANLPASRLKEMAASAKAVSDLVIMELDSGNEGHHLRYWAMDEYPAAICAMVGSAEDLMFQAIGGDDVPHTIQVATKLLHQCASAFDMKRNLDLRLRVENNKHLLVLSQTDKDGEKPDVRTITVQPSTIQPKTPTIPKGAYAPVDLERLDKVLNSIKQNTDVVTVSISPGELEISASTSRLRDGWKHATPSSGRAEGLFAVKSLKRVILGAAETSKHGEIYLTEDEPLKVQAVSEDLIVTFWVAGRESMR